MINKIWNLKIALLVLVFVALFVLWSNRGAKSNRTMGNGSGNISLATGSEQTNSLYDVQETNPSSMPRSYSPTTNTPLPQDDVVSCFAFFLQTGEMESIRDLSREEIKLVISEYVSMVGKDQLGESLHKYFGMSFNLFYSIEKPEDYLMEMVDLVREDIEKPHRLTNLVITDSCSEDGSVYGATHIIPEGSPKIFAVFENCNALEGIETVYAVWRDLNDDSLSFSEYEPLREHSRYNYVWLEQQNGWKKGVYQLDLADPLSPSRILATTKFKVQ